VTAKGQNTQFRHPPALATAVDHDPRWQNPRICLALMPWIENGSLPPRSLAAEANDCFMVWIHPGSNRIQGRSALMPPLISVERCTEKKNRETGSGFPKRLEIASQAFE